MRRWAIAGLMSVVMAAGVAWAQEEPAVPEMPPPREEHQWLERFVGTWEGEGELNLGPDQEPAKVTGKESARMLGGFWVVGEGRSEMMGERFEYIVTLGYDAGQREYIATWVDSTSGHLWISRGSVDEAGDVLTLESEGPCPLEPGAMRPFRDVIEFKSDDHRVHTGYMEMEGQWIQIVRMDVRRTGE